MYTLEDVVTTPTALASPGAMRAARDAYGRALTATLSSGVSDLLGWAREAAAASVDGQSQDLLTYAAVAQRWDTIVARLGLTSAEAALATSAPLPRRLYDSLAQVQRLVNGATPGQVLTAVRRVTATTAPLTVAAAARRGGIATAVVRDIITDAVVSRIAEQTGASHLYEVWDWLETMADFADWLATSSFNARTLEAFRLLGVDAKRWVTRHDHRVRDSHRSVEGDTVPVDAPFLVGGEWLRYPGDPNASPAQTANCRCCMAAVTWSGP